MAAPRPRVGFLFSYLAYEYDTGMWRGLLRAAEARGIDLVAIECSPDPAEAEPTKRLQRSLAEGMGLDAMVVPGTMGFIFLDEQIEAFLSSLPAVPIVLISRSFAGRPSVFVDNLAGILDVTEHLITVHGRRRIAFVAGHAHGADAIQRFEGYREALRRHGIAYDPALVYRPSGEYDPFVGAKAVDSIWENGAVAPDALVANNDDGAISAVRELLRRGVDVPGQVSVAGFDDIGPCLDIKPQITTVRQPHQQIGEAVMDLVLKAMKGAPRDGTSVTVRGIPVFRRSCGCSSSRPDSASRLAPRKQASSAESACMERLARTIEVSLAAADPDLFLDALDTAISSEDSLDPLFELWLDRLTRLFAGKQTAESARLFEAGLELVGRATSVIERSRAAKTRNSYNVLNSFFSRSALSFDNSASGEALLESLPKLGIRDFLFCKCEETCERGQVQRVMPAPGSSVGLLGASGNPAELVRRFMALRAEQGRSGPLVLMRLHHGGSDLGFVICSVGYPDGSLYLALQSQLSNGLKGNALLEEVQGYTRDLEKKVKTLSGYLPICASCKKIRDDKGYWNQVEAYISEHAEVEFSHGLCPDCARKLYPGLTLPERE